MTITEFTNAGGKIIVHWDETSHMEMTIDKSFTNEMAKDGACSLEKMQSATIGDPAFEEDTDYVEDSDTYDIIDPNGAEIAHDLTKREAGSYLAYYQGPDNDPSPKHTITNADKNNKYFKAV